MTVEYTAPSLRAALTEAVFVMETVRNLQGMNSLNPYIERAKAALDADAREQPKPDAVLTPDGWMPKTWTDKGMASMGGDVDTPNDLVPKVKRIKRVYWANVYPDTAHLDVHCTKGIADVHAEPNRIACVKLTIDCKEGDGL